MIPKDLGKIDEAKIKQYIDESEIQHANLAYVVIVPIAPNPEKKNEGKVIAGLFLDNKVSTVTGQLRLSIIVSFIRFAQRIWQMSVTNETKLWKRQFKRGNKDAKQAKLKEIYDAENVKGNSSTTIYVNGKHLTYTGQYVSDQYFQSICREQARTKSSSKEVVPSGSQANIRRNDDKVKEGNVPQNKSKSAQTKEKPPVIPNAFKALDKKKNVVVQTAIREPQPIVSGALQKKKRADAQPIQSTVSGSHQSVPKKKPIAQPIQSTVSGSHQSVPKKKPIAQPIQSTVSGTHQSIPKKKSVTQPIQSTVSGALQKKKTKAGMPEFPKGNESAKRKRRVAAAQSHTPDASVPTEKKIKTDKSKTALDRTEIIHTTLSNIYHKKGSNPTYFSFQSTRGGGLLRAEIVVEKHDDFSDFN